MLNQIVKITSLFLLILAIFGCSSTQKVAKEEKCIKFYKDSYPINLKGEDERISNIDSISINEIRFECATSALHSHKIMFDKFGKWDKEIYTVYNSLPFLVWENVDLYANGKSYNVFTSGLEANRYMYSSVMVFDENYNDLLSNDSLEKERLTKYFGEMMKTIKTKKRKFYEVYWKMIDPKIWKTIESNMRKQ